MSDKDLKVLAECVDIRSGKRFLKGQVFSPPPTPEQADRLIKAGVLTEGAREFAVGEDADASDEDESVNLKKLNIDELKALAAERGVDLGDATKKADIIAAIELADEK
jgi:hypothetical protein